MAKLTITGTQKYTRRLNGHLQKEHPKTKGHTKWRKH